MDWTPTPEWSGDIELWQNMLVTILDPTNTFSGSKKKYVMNVKANHIISSNQHEYDDEGHRHFIRLCIGLVTHGWIELWQVVKIALRELHSYAL